MFLKKMKLVCNAKLYDPDFCTSPSHQYIQTPDTHLSHQSDMLQFLLHELTDLHRTVDLLLTLIPAQVKLLRPQPLGLLSKLRDRSKVVVRVQMPEEGGRDADKRAVGELLLALLDDLDGALVDNDLVEARLDQAARDVLELLAGLHKQVVAGRNLDGDALAGVAGPDVQTGVARAAVDGEEVEVGVEAGEDGVLLAVLFEVGGGGGEEVGAVLENCQCKSR